MTFLKSKSPCILLNKNINCNKNETESRMESPAHSIRETDLVVQLIKELQIKSTSVMNWSSRKRKESIFCTIYFVRRKFFLNLCFISIYSVLNTLSEYTYFYMSKILLHTLFCLFLKSSKAFSISLRRT